jgi:hypothetical protein
MVKALKRSHYTAVAPRFQRSINLHNDWQDARASSGYIVTPNVAQSLERVSEGLLSDKGQRAFALTGPYGTGKSAFAVFLCQLLSRDGKQAGQAAKLLSSDYSELKGRLDAVRKSGGSKEGFLAIPVTARRRPIAQLLLEGMISAVVGLKQSKSVCYLHSSMENSLKNDGWHDTATIINFLSSVAKEAEKQSFAGILLLVDEAGKTLEYALQDRGGGDVYIFQELAEYANRQSKTPVLFLITLHQMFDDYLELSDRTLRNEWNKVQERFQTVQFSESAATTMQMVASALQPAAALPKEVATAIDEALGLIQKNAMPLPLGVEFTDFKVMAHRAWPLHPSVLLAMPHLFRRLAQNERSIFSYLTSHEPFGFHDHLDLPMDKGGNFIRLHHIYAYLLANFEAGLARLPHAKRLLEANDIINSRQHLTVPQLELVQSVALLNVLSEICPLRATPQTLLCATSPSASLEQELEALKQQSILTYRRLDGSYRVWEGSDVDIEARINEGRRKLQMEGTSPMEALCHHLPNQTLVARRHSLETGVHRFFNLIYAENLGKNVLTGAENPDDAAGTIIVLLPQASSKKLEAEAVEKTKGKQRLIVALPRQIEALRGVVEEVACLRWVEENTEELRDDRIARRELSLRLAMSEQHISQLLQTLLDPRPAPAGNSCQWIWNGHDQRPQRPVDVAKLLSHACDKIYPKSPHVRNELVVRKKISSAAASARRILLESMLNRRTEERLGIEGFPAERSVYESVIHATGIHYLDPDSGHWGFRAPPEDNGTRLRPCWDLMEKTIFSEKIQRLGLVDLFSKFSDVPYGLPDGVHPILFTAFYLLYQDELFLYREDTFVPDVQAAHLELLQRRPDLFSVSGAKIDGTRKAVVERLAKGLKQPPKTASVVRALYRVLNTLPQVTQKTMQIRNASVVEMRDCLLQAASPEQLLFVDLPRCFGLEPFMQGQKREKDMDRFFEQLNNSLSTLRDHATKLLQKNRNLLLSHCGLSESMEGWHELESRATWLAPRIKHEVLTPFLNCVNNGIADDHNARPTLSLIANRPFEQWTDMDLEAFGGLAEGMGELFRQTWHNYGDADPVLTEKEQEQKEAFRKTLEPQLKKLGGKKTSRALAAALRELLKQIESN